MRDFNRGNKFWWSNRWGDREMHKAICDDCGKHCTVPFRPTGWKPIYCSECFSQTENSSPRPSFNRSDNYGRSENYGRRESFNSRDSFSKPDRAPRRDTFSSNKPIQPNENNDWMLVKLDKIISLLEKLNTKHENCSSKPIISENNEKIVNKWKEEKVEKKVVIKKVVKKAVAKKPVKKVTAKKKAA